MNISVLYIYRFRRKVFPLRPEIGSSLREHIFLNSLTKSIFRTIQCLFKIELAIWILSQILNDEAPL